MQRQLVVILFGVICLALCFCDAALAAFSIDYRNILPEMIVLCFFSYLLGSVPFGLIFARLFCGIDPRTAGSGNIGTTNIARLCGVKWGLLTLVFDALKGLVPTALTLHIFSGHPQVAATVGLCALLGHLYSIFLRFRGGKAVATTVGVFIPLAFPALLVSGVSCLLVIWRSGYVSLGSLSLATLLPVCLLLFKQYELVPFGLIVMCLIFFKHRENIRRLRRGEEKSWLKNKNMGEPDSKTKN